MSVNSNPTDKELLHQLKAGEESAFTAIYHRYWETLFAIAYNRLRSTEAAEDIVHDVFTSLWHCREQAAINNLKAYLATAVKYMVLAYIKKAKRFHSYLQVKEDTGIDGNSHPEESLHYKGILELLKQEIEQLPEKCKLIFKYSREQNMPAKQIAAELDLSTKTVENQLSKALSRLRVALRNINHFLLSLIW